MTLSINTKLIGKMIGNFLIAGNKLNLKFFKIANVLIWNFTTFIYVFQILSCGFKLDIFNL